MFVYKLSGSGFESRCSQLKDYSVGVEVVRVFACVFNAVMFVALGNVSEKILKLPNYICVHLGKTYCLRLHIIFLKFVLILFTRFNNK